MVSSRVLSSTSELWAQGDVGMLEQPAVGICGSRDASEAGIRYAMEFGRIAAEAGFAVVTGYARGVDSAAHLGALEAGGRTIAVLPEGIQHFHLRKELKTLATVDNLLAVSGFRPDAPWTTWNAMNRNKLIVALSSALFVIEAGEKGGTLDAGLECLRQKKPLYVLEYRDGASQPTGNHILLSKKGVAIRTRRELKDFLNRLMTGSSTESEQKSLEFA